MKFKVICYIVTPTAREVKEGLVTTHHRHSAAASPEQVHLGKQPEHTEVHTLQPITCEQLKLLEWFCIQDFDACL